MSPYPLRRSAWRLAGIAVALAFAWLGSPRVAAEIVVVSPRGIDLDQAIAYALEHNPGLVAARQSILTERVGYQEADAIGDWTANASARATFSGPVASIEFPDPQTGEMATLRIGSPYAANLSVDVAKPLNLGRQRRASREATDVAVQIAEEQVREAELAVALGVKQAFYNVLRSEHMRLVAMDSLDRLAAHLRITEAKFGAGTVAEYDVDRARADVAAARARVTQAEGAVRVALALLSRTMGLDPDHFAQVKSDLVPEFIWVDEARAREVARDLPRLHRIDSQIASLEISMRLIDLEDRVVVSAFGTTGWQTGSGFTDGLNYALGIQATWPLRNGGGDEARIERLKQQRIALELSRADALAQVDTDIRTALEGLATARAAVEDAAQSVIQARTALRKVRLAYDNDVGAWIDLRDTESALTAAEQTFVGTLFGYQLARADLEHAIGVRALGELVIADPQGPPTLPEMAGVSLPSEAQPLPEAPGLPSKPAEIARLGANTNEDDGGAQQ